MWSGGLGGGRARVIPVLCECIWNAIAVSIVPSAFDNTGSLGFLPRQLISSPISMVPPSVTASHFLAGNRDAELTPTTYSSLILFLDFLSFLFS